MEKIIGGYAMIDISAGVEFSCNTPQCTAKGLPREMFSLDKRATGGKRVVCCRDCRKLAHQENVKSYRLDYTLKWEAEQQQKRGFFKTFAVTAQKRNGNGKAEKNIPQKQPALV